MPTQQELKDQMQRIKKLEGELTLEQVKFNDDLKTYLREYGLPEKFNIMDLIEKAKEMK